VKIGENYYAALTTYG